MIQSRDWVTHPTHGKGQVVKVHPTARKVVVAFGQVTRTVNYADLTPEVKGLTPSEMLHTQSVAISKMVTELRDELEHLKDFKSDHAEGYKQCARKVINRLETILK